MAPVAPPELLTRLDTRAQAPSVSGHDAYIHTRHAKYSTWNLPSSSLAWPKPWRGSAVWGGWRLRGPHLGKASFGMLKLFRECASRIAFEVRHGRKLGLVHVRRLQFGRHDLVMATAEARTLAATTSTQQGVRAPGPCEAGTLVSSRDRPSCGTAGGRGSAGCRCSRGRQQGVPPRVDHGTL